ncbi:hypothetical protein [Paraburkholderia heleia]|uniref:hypothetical protein n=1 Tax=Paraburkholderia heleia TaxID=634127 RepID=UPI0005A6A0AA
MYFQWDPKDRVDGWSVDRIWDKWHARVDTADGWQITKGKVYQKNIIEMFSGVKVRRDLRQTRTVIQRQLTTHPRL